jgi:hypothetical protein
MDATETPRTDAVWRNKSFGFYEMRDIANTLERELAAMTAERDALVQTCGELCPRCGWRGLRGDPEQCAFCQNAKLSADLYNMTARAELAERELHNRNSVYLEHVHDLAIERDALKAAKELAERWVNSLEASLQNAATRLHTANMVGAFKSGDDLSEYLTKAYEDARRKLAHCSLVWSRAEAEKGGKG